MSHATLVSEVLRIQIAKGETLTEWRERPLTPAQVRYAFDDVRHLLAAREALGKRLRDLGHETWAEDEFGRLQVQAFPEAKSDGQSERWRKLRGLGSLSRRQLAVAREIFNWRETLALKENRPPRVLLRDDLIIEVARRNPKSDRDLKVMRGLPRRHAQEIMQAVERARALPAAECPVLSERDQDPPQVAVVVNVLAAVLAD
jgi:ribonuclease D